tara:strand:+ start:1449 stop:1712 length:264 start_codon:yes stop_codon:yes gene_type:complete
MIDRFDRINNIFFYIITWNNNGSFISLIIINKIYDLIISSHTPNQNRRNSFSSTISNGIFSFVELAKSTFPFLSKLSNVCYGIENPI